jgi:hypothetical protein
MGEIAALSSKKPTWQKFAMDGWDWDSCPNIALFQDI